MIEFLLFVGGYFALLAALSLAARPYRLRFAALAKELLNDPHSPFEEQPLGLLISSAYSIRTAPSLLLAFAIGLLRRSEDIDRMTEEFAREHPGYVSDKRVMDLLDMHMASAAAVNPIFGALAYAARGLFRLKARAHFAGLNRREQQFPNDAIRAELFEMKTAF